jgi:hypothetical protein
MPEGGGEVVKEPLQFGVVMLVPLVGVKRPYTSGSTARPNGRLDCGERRSGARKRNWVGR